MRTHFRLPRKLRAMIALAATLIAGVVASTAGAAVFQFNATARNDNPNAPIVDFVPVGTPVTASFTLDVGPGDFQGGSFPALTLLGGSYTWDAGGPQVLTLTSADIFPLGVCQNCGPVGSPTDWVIITLGGTGANMAGYTMNGATFQIDLGFGAIASGAEFTDLLAGDPPAMNLGFRFQPDGQFGSTAQGFQRDIQSSITPGGVVPLPGAGWLLAGALAGLGMVRRRRAG